MNPVMTDVIQAGMVITHKMSRWKVLRNIASGPFSDVFIISDEVTSQKYAMKCEKQEGNLRPVLKLDVLVLMAVRGHTGFPSFIAAGRTSTYSECVVEDIYRYCVMQLVGPDLGKLRRSFADKRFSVPTALRVLQQTLRRLEVLHDAGWLCRDVKAPNFAVGLGQESSVIYMLDFGFSRKYKDENGAIIPPRSAAALLGTFQYTSLASHAHKDQARKDDLESWFYMAAELLKGLILLLFFFIFFIARNLSVLHYKFSCVGPLPWSKINGHKEHQLIAEKKRRIRTEGRNEFMQGMPAEFDSILTMIDNMG
uniref:Protein kinase domain-containing protein n=1 Tax=Angiostrongylus cantonensis TaxID=6313 RepID=A0A0K0CZH7_ANGCA